MTLQQVAQLERARRRPRPMLTETYISTQQRGRSFNHDYFTTRLGGVAR